MQIFRRREFPLKFDPLALLGFYLLFLIGFFGFGVVNAFGAFIPWSYFFVPVILLFRFQKAFEFRGDWIKLRVYGLAGTVALCLLASYILGSMNMADPFREKLQGHDKSLSREFFFYLCVVAPIGEEVFFRGLLWRWFLSSSRVGRFREVLKMALIQSAMFSFFHLPAMIFYDSHYYMFFLLQGLLTFCGAMLFNWAFFKTNSLLYCIILHLLFNTLFLVLNYL